ncbi:MAG TPA: YigZ family protein, partial [Bacteroidales bacterium]|nr:YigZ family protein [Bacteroidales bacterium]
MDDAFLTIQKAAQAIFKDRNSRFIGLVFPVDNETQVKEIQAQLRKEYYDARHHCFAYIIGFEKEFFRANDDGEPSGSAGKPIH